MGSFWYKDCKNPESDVVISSRVRLARNISGFLFSSRLNEASAKEIINKVRDSAFTGNEFFNGQFDFLNSKDLTKLQKLSLLERHIVSPDFVKNTLPSAVAIKKDESISIMVNEEDHLRIQVLETGLNLDGVYALANRIDDILNKKLKFSFDETFGYLTQCPTNLGSGMRASLMLHLPALKLNGIMNKLPADLFKFGIAFRGIHGEGTESLGNTYQISNQVTLGISEEQAIKNLLNITKQLIYQERKFREELKSNIEALDAIHRSYGILSNCRLLSADDLLELLSDVRLGVSLGELENVSITALNLLLFTAQSANILVNYGSNISVKEQNRIRAEYVRKVLGV